MKRLLISALAVASLGAAVVPAAAQPYGPYGPAYAGQDLNAKENNIAMRIDQGSRRGDLTRQEAWSLRGQLRDIQNLEYRYRHNGGGYNSGPGGLSGWERQDLQRRLNVLSDRVFNNRHDDQRRYR